VTGIQRCCMWYCTIKRMCWGVNSTVNHSVQTGTRRSGGIAPFILNRDISRPCRDGPTVVKSVWLKKRSFALLNAEPSLLCCPTYNLVTVSATLRRRPPCVPRLFTVNTRQLLRHDCTVDRTNPQAHQTGTEELYR
jgi:hypothetical protein